MNGIPVALVNAATRCFKFPTFLGSRLRLRKCRTFLLFNLDLSLVHHQPHFMLLLYCYITRDHVIDCQLVSCITLLSIRKGQLHYFCDSSTQ